MTGNWSSWDFYFRTFSHSRHLVAVEGWGVRMLVDFYLRETMIFWGVQKLNVGKYPSLVLVTKRTFDNKATNTWF